MKSLYPMVLAPTFVERVWGGRRLDTWYPAELPAGPIGEAWALSAHASAPSTVTNGALSGVRLDSVWAKFSRCISGKAGARFPVLVKLIHAAKDLSVQVHPDDTYEGLAPGQAGKSEMWLVLHAEPGASIVHGVNEGVTRRDLASAAQAGSIEECLCRVPVQAGDVVPVPPGTIHALGAGTVVAEVQQNSDTTYRLWDYNRPGLDGKPRQLHLQDGLAVASVAAAPSITRPAAGTMDEPTRIGVLPGRLVVGYAQLTGGYEAEARSLLGLLVIQGNLEVGTPAANVAAGHCMLIPESCGECILASRGGASVITMSFT